MVVGTKEDFERLAQFILDDYLSQRTTREMYNPIDIKDFAINYLHMNVRYECFAPESGIAGMRVGQEIILDEALLEKGKEGIHNFTLAHECGHELVNWQDESYQPKDVVNYRDAQSRKRKRLETEEDFREWQANVVAAYLLMPPLLMGWCFYTFARMERIKIYGDYYMTKNDRSVVNGMKDYLKVSKEALLIRLAQLNMLEYRPIDEYYEIPSFTINRR